MTTTPQTTEHADLMRLVSTIEQTAVLLGVNDAKKGHGIFTAADGRFQHHCHDSIYKAKTTLSTAISVLIKRAEDAEAQWANWRTKANELQAEVERLNELGRIAVTTGTQVITERNSAQARLNAMEGQTVSKDEFTDWLEAEMPSGTIIGKAGWWASRIYTRFIAPGAAPKLSKFKLLAITTAYEQGVGKGKQRTDFNPYSEGTDEREAWRLGYKEGEGMAAQAEPKPPHECKTEAEKIAFAFGWWKALELGVHQPSTVIEQPAPADDNFGLSMSMFASKQDYETEKNKRARAALDAMPPAPRMLSDAEIVACVESAGYKTWDSRVFKFACALLAAAGARDQP